LKEKALWAQQRYSETSGSETYICAIDSKPIKDMRDAILFHLLTSNEEEELYKYNFLVLNRTNINKWKDRDAFLSAASNFLELDKWGILSPNCSLLSYLIERVSNPDRVPTATISFKKTNESDRKK
jgi:hypothetical protein